MGNAVTMAKRLEVWPVERLTPYASNARTHSPEQIDKIAASIIEFGFTNPILVDGAAGIIAGHGRLTAALQLGLLEVPVIELTHLTDAQKRAYILADNRLALDAGWDEDLLAAELLALQADGFDLSLTGFNDDELAELLADDEAEGGLTDPDDAPPLPADPISCKGDIWIVGRHRVMCGDSTFVDDIERLMAGAAANAMWTDPPYNVAYTGKTADALTIDNDSMSDADFYQFLLDVFAGAGTVMLPGAPAYIAHADSESINFRRAFGDAGFHLSSGLIWRKNCLVLSRGDYHYQHEPILYGWKKGAAHVWHGARDKTTIIELQDSPFQQIGDGRWQISMGERTLIVSGTDLAVEVAHGSVFFEEKPSRNAEHPTMKPVALIERMVANSTKRADVVLDLFGGSGSTLIACEKSGRAARLMELDAKYVDVIVKRWQDFSGKMATLEGDGRTFDRLALDRKPVG